MHFGAAAVSPLGLARDGKNLLRRKAGPGVDYSRPMLRGSIGTFPNPDPPVASFRRLGDPQSLVTREAGVNENGSFASQKAPCGRSVSGHHYEDHDDEVVVTRETIFDCGCLSIQREYHDGSVSRRVVRHDGRVLTDEMLSAE
jgi:hypothetical protein